MIDVMKFWLDLGVDALRLDAVPYLCVREGTNNENLPETHDVLKRMRRAMDTAYQGRMLLAEANQWPSDVRPYFGDGDECHMAFHFPLMPRMFMRCGGRSPRITEILIRRRTFRVVQWACSCGTTTSDARGVTDGSATTCTRPTRRSPDESQRRHPASGAVVGTAGAASSCSTR